VTTIMVGKKLNTVRPQIRERTKKQKASESSCNTRSNATTDPKKITSLKALILQEKKKNISANVDRGNRWGGKFDKVGKLLREHTSTKFQKALECPNLWGRGAKDKEETGFIGVKVGTGAPIMSQG